MKLSQFRRLIKEEIQRALTEGVTRITIESHHDINALNSIFQKLGDALTNVRLVSNQSYFKKYTAQLDLDKLKAALDSSEGVEIGNARKDTVSVFRDSVLAFDFINLDANTFNTLKQLIKPTKQKLNSVTDYVEAIVDMASSGAGASTGLKSIEFANIVKKIKAGNLTNAVDKALVKYINNTEESFTEDDIEALQSAGFKMSGINYDNLGF